MSGQALLLPSSWRGPELDQEMSSVNRPLQIELTLVFQYNLCILYVIHGAQFTKYQIGKRPSHRLVTLRSSKTAETMTRKCPLVPTIESSCLGSPGGLPWTDHSQALSCED